jgi:hypothetical protein
MPAVAARIAGFGIVSIAMVYHLSGNPADDLDLTSADSDQTRLHFRMGSAAIRSFVIPIPLEIDFVRFDLGRRRNRARDSSMAREPIGYPTRHNLVTDPGNSN